MSGAIYRLIERTRAEGDSDARELANEAHRELRTLRDQLLRLVIVHEPEVIERLWQETRIGLGLTGREP